MFLVCAQKNIGIKMSTTKFQLIQPIFPFSRDFSVFYLKNISRQNQGKSTGMS